MDGFSSKITKSLQELSDQGTKNTDQMSMFTSLCQEEVDSLRKLADELKIELGGRVTGIEHTFSRLKS